VDKIVRVVLRFDRFVLDLSRGSLSANGRNIELPPKAFEVLRYLAENSGQLVSKQELHQAAWHGVVVSDDSLTQCIHQLRQKLDDGEHRLIKTVPRRGYLLDAIVTEGTAPSSAQEAPAPQMPGGAAEAMRMTPSRGTHRWIVSAGLAVIILLGAYLLAPRLISPSHSTQSAFDHLISRGAASELFTTADARRIARVAEIKQLPIPAFQVRTPSTDIPQAARRFIGVWVSGSGWINSNRQFMLIVTHINSDGTAEGYTVDGPPQPKSLVQDTAIARTLKAQISTNTLFYSGRHGDIAATLTPQDRIEFKLTYRDGRVGVVSLDPVWTLVTAERTEFVAR
jgi:DNA-binding winged helix-turn-helix (wHTH) protein